MDIEKSNNKPIKEKEKLVSLQNQKSQFVLMRIRAVSRNRALRDADETKNLKRRNEIFLTYET